jgi:HlyD family secretion protein
MNGVMAWLMGLLAIIPGLGTPQPLSWNGYVEDDYLYASAPTGGIITAIPVVEGQVVKKGDTLFVLDSRQEEANFDAAKATADAARATLANLQTGSRPQEIEVTLAQLQKGQSDLLLAQQVLARDQGLFKKGFVPQSQIDSDNSAVASAQSEIDQAKAQVVVAQLPARDEQQAAAAAQFNAAAAQAVTAQAALDDRTVTAPADAYIERLFFKVGEVAGAGVPVLSINASNAMRVEFYVAQGERQRFSMGGKIDVSCDGCADGLTATITYFSSSPEFTPPIIYSRDERNRLVFHIEATMDQQAGILPGQPVTVRLPQ